MAKKLNINKAFVEAYLKDNNGYPETGFFKEQKDLQKFYKFCTDEQLTEWVDVEGLEFKPADSQPINRMRMAMAILYYHFPKEASTKKKSKYADYTNEVLIQMLLDNDVPCEVTDDERIMRMRAIMALRASKIIE